LNKQVNDASMGSLTVGTSAVVTHTVGEPVVNEHKVTVPVYGYGKREAVETVNTPVVKPLVYGVNNYFGVPYAHPHHAVTYAGVHGVVAPAVQYVHPAVVPATHEVTYKTITPTVETNVVATNNAVPVSVGGYKAVAGDNGELMGAVHEVPAVFGAPALNKQVNDASMGSLTVGTSAVVTHTVGEPIVNEHKVNVPTYGVYGYGKK